ncbi:hypothetical protein V9L05_24020 (plasmid) [Bernardetia sp. Wsw4-3y2]|uniref:hypothetical protein n=1 Tax=Bernardetia sp. Wsw4-3y2 TaxID=3127471 RepID=UPI0030CD6E90
MQTFYSKLRVNFLKFRNGRWSFSFVEDEREENGVVYQQFNNFPNKESYSDIKSISFLVFDDELKKVQRIPNFLNELPNLEVVSVPIAWLCSIKTPLNIKAITLINTLRLQDKYSWCEGLFLENLLYLEIPELIKPFDIDFNNVPHLKWIKIDLKAEKKDTKLTQLAQLKNLKHLSFGQAKNFDVFMPFKDHQIESLELFACKGKSFPIENIQLLKSLKYIRINNISVEFDCSLILELPNLLEIELLNIKNVTNIEKLLEHKTLKSLVITDCKNPFKEVGKDIFKNKGYKLLRIDYA